MYSGKQTSEGTHDLTSSASSHLMNVKDYLAITRYEVLKEHDLVLTKIHVEIPLLTKGM